MKTKFKILMTVVSTVIVVGLTLAINIHSVNPDVLGQLNNAKDLTIRDYHVEKTMILFLIDAIINAVVWTSKEKEKQPVNRKEIDFDFLNYKRKNDEK